MSNTSGLTAYEVGYNIGKNEATTYYQPLLDAKDEIINTLKMRQNDNFCSTLGIAAERSEVSALKAQLEAKDAEIAELRDALKKKTKLELAERMASRLYRDENTTLKALLEQAREKLREVAFYSEDNDAQFVAHEIVAAINAATGENLKPLDAEFAKVLEDNLSEIVARW